MRSALKIITSFTVAHSITLALTALKVIHLPSALVEPMIAASIVYVGFENLLRRNTDKRWMLTFCFGLVHGCGFASALQDLGVGENGTPILLPLVSFNLGVEIGQLAIAAIVLPIIWQCQSSPRFVRQWVPIGSTAIALMGGFWLLQRTMTRLLTAQESVARWMEALLPRFARRRPAMAVLILFAAAAGTEVPAPYRFGPGWTGAAGGPANGGQ